MDKQETLQWERGVTDAPLPPLADMQIVHNTEDPFLELYHRYGPVYRIPRQDKEPLVVLAGDEANAFTSRYGDEFFVSTALWKEFNNAMGGMVEALATTRDGEANRQRRMKVSRDYARTKVLDQLPRMVDITQQNAQWYPDQTITVLPAMQRIVAEQLGQLLVNYSIGDYLEDFVIYLSTSIATSFGSTSKDTRSSPRFQQAKARVLELGRIIVEAHRATPLHNHKPDLVDDALASAATRPEAYTETRLTYSAIGPLLAGLETVARANTFMLYALLTNPEAFKRVLDEADTAFAQGPLNWERLKSMTATQGAAMETLRMYTGSSFSAIIATPLTYAGYRLEPGNEVHVAIAVSHFLPGLFPQPETFDIDRYHAPRNEHRQRGAYAPFGLGEHSCLGAGIAEVQLMVITATLLHNYRFELEPLDYQLKPGQRLTNGDEAESETDTPFRLKIVALR